MRVAYLVVRPKLLFLLKICHADKAMSHGANFLATCKQLGNVYLPNLHLPGVDLRCKLQEKLHRVSGPI